MIVFRYLRVFLFAALIFSVAQPALSQQSALEKAKALWQAALKEMKILQKRYGHTNPFYWAAFVFMGEP